MNARWILAGILLLLLAAAYGTGMLDEKISTVETPQLNVPDEQPSSIHISGGNQEIALQRKDGRWMIMQPVTARADSPAVRTLLTNLQELSIDRVVTSSTDRLASYGLDTGAVEVSINWADQQETLVVGDPGTGSASRYVQIGDDARILMSDGNVRAETGVDAWRNKTVLAIAPGAIQRISVSGPGGDYQVSEQMGSWQVSSSSGGGSAAVDSAQARRWIDRFSTLRATGIVTDARGSNVRENATHTVTIATAGGQTSELYLQKSDQQVRAVTGAGDTVYELPAWRLNRLVPSRESLVSGGGGAPSPRIRTAPGQSGVR